MELDECGVGIGVLRVGGSPGESELIADSVELGLFCSRGSTKSSFQAEERPCGLQSKADVGAEALGTRGQAVTFLWLKAKGLD